MNRLGLILATNFRLSRHKWVIQQARTQSSKTQLEEKVTNKQESSDEPVEFKGAEYDKSISENYSKKLPAREPLLKNFFIGKIEKSMITFPEVISRDDMQRLEGETQEIRQYFGETLGSQNITEIKEKGSKDDWKNLGLLGNNIPKEFGGRGYSCSESLLASEPETISTDISLMLSSHRLVVELLQKYGNQEQIERYLPMLANAAATEALYEEKPAKIIFNTKAVYNDMDKIWVLNGEKSFVSNGTDAKFFLVFAETENLDISGEISPGVTVFMVDGTSSGIQRANLSPVGCKKAEFAKISFNGVHVPESEVIGEVNAGGQIAFNLLKFHRLRMSLTATSLMKRLTSHLSELCVTTKVGEMALKDTEISGIRLSKLVCQTYALESMVYYTAGLIDEFDNQDVELEAACTKLFSLDCLLGAVKAPMAFVGPISLLPDQPTYDIITNALQLYTHGESRDSLELYTGLLGLQFAGMAIYETVRKKRNPLFNPTFMLGQLFQIENINNPKPKWNLNEDLHPSLHIPSKLLEESMCRMKLCTELMLTRHGNNVMEKQAELRRMAEIASLVYAMFATLSRASRSYCIGLRHSDYELLLSHTICADATNRIKELATEIDTGAYLNNDRNHLRISKQIFKSKGFFLEHPTKYNF